MAIRKKSIIPAVLLLLLFATPLHAEVFKNPLAGTSAQFTFIDLIVRIIFYLLGLSALIALLAVVIGGLRLTLGGFDNEAEAARAKKILFWAMIGFMVTIASVAIVTIVADMLRL